MQLPSENPKSEYGFWARAIRPNPDIGQFSIPR
jgi:hypothetical protein